MSAVGLDPVLRDRPAQQVRRVALAGVVLLLLGTLVAVLAGWPAQFGGSGDPDAVASEFLSRGTALSPPLVPLALFALAGLLAARPGRLGAGARAVLLVLSVVFVIGGVGEAAAAGSSPDVPDVALLGSGAVAIALGLAVAVLTVRTWRRDGTG